jgi:hypothetical protein
MPYVTLDGKLVELTEEQFGLYTIGQNLSASRASIQTSVPNIAAGGTVTQTNSATATILTPNTTNTSPGQTLNTIAAPAVNAESTTLQQDLPDVTIVTETTQTNTSATAVDPATTLSPGETILATSDINTSASPVLNDWQAEVARTQELATTTFENDGAVGSINDGARTSADNANASANIQGLIKSAQQQQTLANQRKQINNGDWRVRLRLAPQAKYLYNAPNPGILKPLQVTDGIIFPYTPAINTSYRAQYTPYDLTHSNYRGYWYQNSYVNEINLTAIFTAQDTNDANYLLAVIHFLRSATKMFYGQDAERGSPPPLVYLSGLGDYQFREHACAISSFVYNLPADVDYIRAGSPNNAGLDFNNIRDRQSVATNSIFGAVNRLAAAFLTKGAITGAAAPPTLGLNRPTYVPTKMEIQLTLLPVQSRQQVSKQFSLKEFANGNLLKGGFW